MPISIVTRAYKASELKKLIENLNSYNEVEKEIVAVCNIKDCNIKNVRLIIENSNRFRAKIIGIKKAKFENILLLDSDQIPEKGLLEELDTKKEDMIIIPEKSLNNDFTSKCLDDWRYRNEKLARKRITPYIPVIPRFYRKKYLLNAINKISADIYNIIDHEDSILYYYVFQETKNINFAKKHIYNYDPKFFKLMYKAFLYGKNRNDIKNSEIPDDISTLLYQLNKSILNMKELGFGKGYIIQIMRGISYEFGKIFN